MERAGEILRRFLRRQVMREAGQMAAIVEGWRQSVGNPHGMHTRVVDLQGETLVVEVDHTARIQLLQMKRTDILRGIRSAAPRTTITDIRYRVAPGGVGAGAAAAAGTRADGAAPAGDAVSAEVEMENEELREALRRLYKKLRFD